MVIQVQKSKNDQLRKGNEVVISELSNPTCPVSLLKRYLDKFRIPPNSRDLIFKPISRGKGFCKLVTPDKPISYSCIRDGFRRDSKNIGVDPSKFGLHSLRSSGATSAANNGINDRILSSLLRRRTCMLMIASSKDSQFLSVWVCNCFPCAQYFVILACFGLVLAWPSPNKLICLFTVFFIRYEVETKYVISDE